MLKITRQVTLLLLAGALSFPAYSYATQATEAVSYTHLMPGIMYGDSLPVHNELDATAGAYVNAIAKGNLKKLTPVWKKGLCACLLYTSLNFQSLLYLRKVTGNMDVGSQWLSNEMTQVHGSQPKRILLSLIHI